MWNLPIKTASWHYCQYKCTLNLLPVRVSRCWLQKTLWLVWKIPRTLFRHCYDVGRLFILCDGKYIKEIQNWIITLNNHSSERPHRKCALCIILWWLVISRHSRLHFLVTLFLPILLYLPACLMSIPNILHWQPCESLALKLRKV